MRNKMMPHWSVSPLILAFLVLGLDAATPSSDSIFPYPSPAWLADVAGPTGNAVISSYPDDASIKKAPLGEPYKFDKSQYPPTLKQPSPNHPEVQKVIAQLDWSKVPPIPPRKINGWSVDTRDYDARADPACWWSATTCKKPKLSYLPEDIYMCPNAGDWGLNYDDGPYHAWGTGDAGKEWQEPRFFNFLVDHGKQKATFFFIGSNIVDFPEGAQRALNDGHTICAHTWSHPQMTSLTNEEIVAQLYWTHKALKEILGVTPKCWRPPYGDVDDRVRAIAWLMGMRTFHWDQDSNDWNMYGTPARGSVPPEEIDKHYEEWINKRKNNLDTANGHITLAHENSNSTIYMSEKWLPKLQEAFNVMPIHKCLNDPYPYWEQSWTYPTLDTPVPNKKSSVDRGQTANTRLTTGNDQSSAGSKSNNKKDGKHDSKADAADSAAPATLGSVQLVYSMAGIFLFSLLILDL